MYEKETDGKATDVSNPANRINAGTFATTGDRGSIAPAGLDPGKVYLLRVNSPNIVPTVYDVRFNLTNTTTLLNLPNSQRSIYLCEPMWCAAT